MTMYCPFGLISLAKNHSPESRINHTVYSWRAMYGAISSRFLLLKNQICTELRHKKTTVTSGGRELRNIYNSTITDFDNLVKDLFCVIKTAQPSRV